MKGYFEKMKKFVLAFGIPVLAVASLIGSGYATWYFNNTVAPDSKNITVEPTPSKVVGAKFQQGGANIKLVLDQSDKTATDGMPIGRKGVHFEETFSESLVADDGDNLTTDDKFVSGISYKITTKITIPSEVATYVNFTLKGEPDQISSTTNLILTKETTFVPEDNQIKLEDFFKISHGTGNTDVTVEYAKEPSTLAEYNIMVDAVKDKTIDISFAAEIVTTK